MTTKYYDQIFDAIFNSICETPREVTNDKNERKETRMTSKNEPTRESKPTSAERKYEIPRPIRIICNEPATIVYWDDGSKTVVKCDSGKLMYDENGGVTGYEREPDNFTAEGGLSAAYIKRLFGSRCEFKRLLNIVEYSKPKKVKAKSNTDTVSETTEYPEYEQLTFDFGDNKKSESEVNE